VLGEAALRLNPKYEFGVRQFEQHGALYLSSADLDKKQDKDLIMYRRFEYERAKQKYERSPFGKYEKFLTRAGISLCYNAKTKITVYGPREKIGRNDPCPCGSKKKFKHCCGG
jgi:uncharacterized protein YchJ